MQTSISKPHPSETLQVVNTDRAVICKISPCAEAAIRLHPLFGKMCEIDQSHLAVVKIDHGRAANGFARLELINALIPCFYRITIHNIGAKPAISIVRTITPFAVVAAACGAGKVVLDAARVGGCRWRLLKES